MDTHSYASKICVGPIDTQIQTLTLSLHNLNTHKSAVNLLCLVFLLLLLLPPHDIDQWCMCMREKHRETKGEKLTQPLLIRELYNQITKGLTSPGWATESSPQGDTHTQKEREREEIGLLDFA